MHSAIGGQTAPIAATLAWNEAVGSLVVSKRGGTSGIMRTEPGLVARSRSTIGKWPKRTAEAVLRRANVAAENRR